jgi:transcriptional regulator with XRE-family HTH domain
MKKINIQHEANIKAEGEHNNGNCDSCIILETGEVFTSQVDLAKRLGVTSCAVSNVICGRQRTCKGYHIVSVSRLAEGVDMVLSRLRETSAMEDKAKKWEAYEAEQEAIRKAEEKRIEEERKAEEKRQAEIAKLQDKRASLNAKCSEYEAKWHDTIDEIVAVEKALEALGVTIDEEEGFV